MIDFEDRDQVLRLALSGIFMSILVARGVKTTPAEAAQVCVECADALINAVATPPAP